MIRRVSSGAGPSGVMVTAATAFAPRRRLLLAATAGLLLPAGMRGALARECDVCGEGGRGAEDEVVQPAKPSPSAFMQLAMELRDRAGARGESAIGAVIALDNVVLSVGSPHVKERHDPTSHAEMEAIRMACRRHATNDLSGAVLYVTSRPCRMCETAAFHARVSRIVHSDALLDGGAPRQGE